MSRVTGGVADPAAYEADRTYALTGDFYRVSRDAVNQYYMQFQLVSFATNQSPEAARFLQRLPELQPAPGCRFLFEQDLFYYLVTLFW